MFVSKVFDKGQSVFIGNAILQSWLLIPQNLHYSDD